MRECVGAIKYTNNLDNGKPSPATTYIMKGQRSKRTLDIYHLILAPSYSCNIRCRHCYLPNHDKHCLSKETVLRLIDDWSQIVIAERKAMGGIFHLKGGEPLILPYLSDVLDKLEKIRALRFMMTTNGILEDCDKVVKRLQNLSSVLGGEVQIIEGASGTLLSIYLFPEGGKRDALVYLSISRGGG